MADFEINRYDFNNDGKVNVLCEKRGKDWPVVYLIHNDKEIYIGETQNAVKRFEQHLNNPARKNLKKIDIIFDDEFNKSAILDIEQSLIQLCSADGKFKIQNLNGGQSEKHNYYQREKYINKIEVIWDELTKLGMTNMSIEDIKNTDLFKYSPYNTLTNEQNEFCKLVIYDMMDKLSKNIKGVSIINGAAGTEKTIVLINIIFKLINASKFEFDFSEEESLTDNNQLIHDIKEFTTNYKKELKIGYVVPMTSIRKTLKAVFNKTKNGLSGSMVIGPFDVFKEDYDVVFVDEAHRLSQYKNISYRGEFAKKALMLDKNPEDTNQLEMILANSKYTVLVYDKNQTVKGSDISKEQFNNALKNLETSTFNLTSQMRCVGGNLYIDYLSDIFECKQNEKLELENYDFKLFTNVNDMILKIKELDKKYDLCRNAAGYSWEWISKKCKTYAEVISKGLEDIKIGEYKYVWNMNNQEFIISENAINEIGCIHTLQGYDLNYVGVILGEEIDYDKENNKLVIDLNKFYDKYVKQQCDYETVYNYIINSYKVIMSRGIKGCYVYACNKNMQEYLEKFINKN